VRLCAHTVEAEEGAASLQSKCRTYLARAEVLRLQAQDGRGSTRARDELLQQARQRIERVRKDDADTPAPPYGAIRTQGVVVHLLDSRPGDGRAPIVARPPRATTPPAQRTLSDPSASVAPPAVRVPTWLAQRGSVHAAPPTPVPRTASDSECMLM
jgi:hypothetical protein